MLQQATDGPLGDRQSATKLHNSSKKEWSGRALPGSGTIHDSRGFPDVLRRKSNVRNFAGLYNPRQESESLVFMKEKYRIGDGEKSTASKHIERTVRLHQEKLAQHKNLLKNRAGYSVNPSAE